MEKEFRFYTLNEVSKIIGVTVRTLYRYIDEGKLKARKIGNKWQVTYKDLEAYIEGNK